MHKNNIAAVAFALLLVFCFAVEFHSVRVAEANFMYPPLERIYIGSDGTISPLTASISRVGDVYTLTGNITNYVIEVQRDNIVIDGAGHSIQKTLPAYGSSDAVALKGRNNVTVKNLEVYAFGYGVYVSSSFNCAITGNKFANNKFGIVVANGSSNFISGNSLISGGIAIYYSANNVFKNNSMEGNSTNNFWVDCERPGAASDFVNDVDKSNTVNGKPICYWVNQHDQVVPVDAGYVGLINCSGITVQNLNLSNNGQGVLLISTTGSKIANNSIIRNNKGAAIFDSQNNNFTWNVIANNTFGFVVYSGNNTFKNNRLDFNTNDVNFEDRFVDEFDFSNIVDGKPICYWIWQNDKTVPVDVGYVVLLSCSNITVQNLNITNRRQAMVLVGLTDSVVARNIMLNNGAGIILKGSSNNRILGNLVANNSDGVNLEASMSNEFSGNRITFNVNFGIQSNDCSNNVFAGNYIAHSRTGFTLNRGRNNTVSGNSILCTSEKGFHVGESDENTITGNNIAWSKGRGLMVTGSVGNNKIHHNDFVNNVGGDPFQALPGSSTINVWDDGSEGNFWSDYQNKYPMANEIDARGIWDTPVVMNANNTDNYPLSKPVNMKYQLTILQPANRVYNSSNVPLVFFATAPVSWMGYSLDGKANVTVNGDILLDNLSVGTHSVTVCAGDHEGEVCASETLHFAVDNETGPCATTEPTDSTSQSPQPTTGTSSTSTPSLSPLLPFSTDQATSFSSPVDSEEKGFLPASLGWLFLVAAIIAVVAAATLFAVKRRS